MLKHAHTYVGEAPVEPRLIYESGMCRGGCVNRLSKTDKRLPQPPPWGCLCVAKPSFLPFAPRLRG